MSKLKIYSDKKWLMGKRPNIFMQPFWCNDNKSAPHEPNVLTKYRQIGSQFFELTSEENAEVVIFPISWEQSTPANVASVAEKLKLKLIVFSLLDATSPVQVDNTITFKRSYHKSWTIKLKNRWVFGFPAFSGDLLYTYTDGFSPLEKTPKPKVGFYGLREPPVRRNALHQVDKHSGITTDFTKLLNFFAGQTTNNPAGLVKARKIFTQNIVANHYTVCVRGAGNFSFRLGETLNCGRIPIFVDTDCLLPVETIIDWKKYCVWVQKNEVPNIGEIILNHYNSYSPEEFIVLQKECREFWENYLSPEGFFSHLDEIIRPCL